MNKRRKYRKSEEKYRNLQTLLNLRDKRCFAFWKERL